MIAKPNCPADDTLEYGYVVTVTPASGASVAVTIDYLNGTSNRQVITSARTFGPYAAQVKYHVDVIVGPSAAVVESAATLSVMPTLKTNSDGSTSLAGYDETADLYRTSRQYPKADLTVTVSLGAPVPLSVGTDGLLYGSAELWSKQPVRSGDGFATVENGQLLGIAGDKSIIYLTRVAEGYFAVAAPESYPGAPGTNTALTSTAELWFSTEFASGWTKIADIGNTRMLAISKPVWSATHGGTVILVGEYSNTAGASHTLYWSTNGGASFTALVSNGASGLNVIDDPASNSHFHGSCYDTRTGRIYISMGDADNAWFGYSDDDGSTWTAQPAVAIGTNNAFTYHQPVLVHPAGAGIIATPDGSAGYAGPWVIDRTTGVELAGIELGTIQPANQFAQAPIAENGRYLYILAPMTGARTSASFYVVASGDGGSSWHQVYTGSQGADEYFDRGIVGPDINGKLYAHRRTWDGVSPTATSDMLVFTPPEWVMVYPAATSASGNNTDVASLLAALGVLRVGQKLNLDANGGAAEVASLTVNGNNTVSYWGSSTGGSTHTWDTPATGASSIRHKVNGNWLCTYSAAAGYGQVEYSGTITYIKFIGASGGMIATQTTQKLGFWGATPVVKQTGTPAAATDLATALTLLNDLRTKLLTIGIVG